MSDHTHVRPWRHIERRKSRKIRVGSVEVGAVFPAEKGCTWSFWLGTVTGPHHKARSVDAAKAAITKLFCERTGLPVKT